MHQELPYPHSTLAHQNKPYSLGTISTPNSPQNINFAFLNKPAGLSNHFEYTKTNFNQKVQTKPVSVKIYSSTQQNSFLNNYPTLGSPENWQNSSANTAFRATGVPYRGNQYQQSQQYKRLISSTNVTSNQGSKRTNFRYFGTDARENASKSTSPPLVANQAQSRSPFGVNSNSSQSRKQQQRVTIEYKNPFNFQNSRITELNNQSISVIQPSNYSPNKLVPLQQSFGNSIHQTQITNQTVPIVSMVSQPVSTIHTIHQPIHTHTTIHTIHQPIQTIEHISHQPLQSSSFTSTQPFQNFQPHQSHYQYSQTIPNNFSSSLSGPNNANMNVAQSPTLTITSAPLSNSVFQNNLSPVSIPNNNLNNNQQVVPAQQNVVVTSTTIIWEHRFVQIYSKFQIFVEKFQIIIEQIYEIDDLFDNVNDEQAWNELRIKYNYMTQKFNQMRQQIITVLQQNKGAVNSLSPEVVQQIQQKHKNQQNQQGREQEQYQQQQEQNQGQEEGGQTGKSGSENNNIWQNRCMELMQHHEQLNRQNNQLKNQLQRLKMESNENQGQERYRFNEQEYSRYQQIQKNFNALSNQYKKLQQNYGKISIEYSRVVSQLQNRVNLDNQNRQQDNAELEQQLEMAQTKIQQLYEQIKSKNNHIQSIEKQYEIVINENKQVIQTINKLHQQLETYQFQYKKCQKSNNQYEQQVQRLQKQMQGMMKKIQQLSNRGDVISVQQYQKRVYELESLRQKERSLLNLIENHEHTIQQMAMKNRNQIIQLQAANQQKDQQIKILQQFVQQEREQKHRLMIQNSKIQYIQPITIPAPLPQYQPEPYIQPVQPEIQSPKKYENISETRQFKQRLRIQIEQVLFQKNRKLKTLTQDLEQLRYQIQNVKKEKQRQIKQIREFFQQQQEKNTRKINEKENLLKILQQKIKSYQHQLSNRNLQISKFRHQSPRSSLNVSSEQSKKFNQQLEKKNYQIKQLKRTIEQKNVDLKEVQQKVYSLQLQINGKVFEISSLKKQAHDIHGNRAEVQNLNNTIKKKNKQISELRLSLMELDQLKMNIDSLQRQKIRINERLKQKSRECQAKDSTIQNLQRKINANSIFNQNLPGSRKTSVQSTFQANNPILTNYENLLKQKQGQIKTTKYELQVLQTKVQISQKTIRDLNSKVTNYQRSGVALKADIENKISKYETQIKNLNKQIKVLKDNKQQLSNIIESLQRKNQSLEKSLDQRNNLFDKESAKNREKVSSVQTYNNNLLVDQQLLRTQIQRLNKDNKQLNDKILGLQQKIQARNKTINQIKQENSRKQKQQIKYYEQKIKKLDGQLKLYTARIKIMEQQKANLNKKYAVSQSEKKSYRDKLMTEQSIDKPDYISFRLASEQYESVNNQMAGMERFRLKDPQANEVFERRVIYDLKRQNDMLRKQLSGVGMSSFATNRYETHQRYYSQGQAEMFPQREREQNQGKADEYNNQLVAYHKNKNKQLESRIDELLKVNNQLKEKISSLTSGNINQFSIQFYKDQVSKLQLEVTQLKSRIKSMVVDHQNFKDSVSHNETQQQQLRDRINDQNLKINQLQNTIRGQQDKISQLQNYRSILSSQIERLNQVVNRSQRDYGQSQKKDKTISDLNKNNRNLEQQIAKLTNRNSILVAEIQRLNQQLKTNKSELNSKFGENSQQVKKLRKRILQLEKQLEILQLQHHSQSQNISDISYKIEKIRSFFSQIETLVGQIPVCQKRQEQLIKQIRSQVQQGLVTISSIQI